MAADDALQRNSQSEMGSMLAHLNGMWLLYKFLLGVRWLHFRKRNGNLSIQIKVFVHFSFIQRNPKTESNIPHRISEIII